MKPENLSDAIGMIDEETVADADRLRQQKPKEKPSAHLYRWVGLGAAACLCIAAVGIRQSGGLGLIGIGKSSFDAVTTDESAEETTTADIDDSGYLSTDGDAVTLAYAAYPEEIQYPGEEDDDAWEEWWEQWRSKRLLEVDTTGMTEFFTESSQIYLSGAGEENAVYSPIGLYFALSMLAETANGETQAQILSALGTTDLKTLRTQAGTLWYKNYQDDGYATSIFANSIWLSNELSYSAETVDNLAEYYYAFAFCGTPGSEAYNELLQDWVNEQTGGFLSDKAEGLQISSDSVLEILSASLFESAWSTVFLESNNADGTFHGAAGDTEVTYMTQADTGTLYVGEGYTAAALGLQTYGTMWFILPDEDSSVDEVLENELADILTFTVDWEEQENLTSVHGKLHLSIPKFDITSELDLTDGLSELGITDATDAAAADFSALIEEADSGDYILSAAKQATRVMIDEEGVSAASYTDLGIVDAAEAEKEAEDLYFTLDRPFLFIITGSGGTTLYIGVVNQIP